PDARLAQHTALSLLLAALFTGFLAFICMRYAADNLMQWLETDLRAGRWEAIAIPYWSVTLAMPVGFGLTAARFVGQAIGILRGKLTPVPQMEELLAAQRQSEASSTTGESAS